MSAIEALVTDAQMLKRENGEVVSISLGNRTDVTDASLIALLDLRHVRELFLGGTSITDRGLEFIKHMQSLAYLELSDTRITDKGLEIVSGFSRLQHLILYGCDITDTGLQCLEGLRDLTELGLEETAASAQGKARFLISLPNVEIS